MTAQNNQNSQGIRSDPASFLFAGLLILAGIVVLATAIFSSVITVIFLGWLLLIGGAVQLVSALFVKGKRLQRALLGIFYGIAGLIILANPLISLLAVTLALAILMTVSGIMRIIWASTSKVNNKALEIIGGALTFLLGILIWISWPAASLVALGVFLGIDLIVAGIVWMIDDAAISTRLKPI